MNLPQPVRFIRTRLTWQAYLTIAYYSYLLNCLGPLTPFLRAELNLSYTVASFHFSAYALGIIVTGLVMNWAVQRVGVKTMVWVGVFGMAAGALLLVSGRSPAITIAGSFLMGLLGVLMSALFNSALAEQHGIYRGVAIVESTTLASLLSAIAPVTVSTFARTALNWRAALWIFLLAAPLLWLVYGRNPIRMSLAPQEGTEAQNDPAAAPRSLPGPLPFAYWLYWALAFLVEAVEFCIIFWAPDYLETVTGFSKANAALALSAFMGAMLVGRLFISRLLMRSQEQRILMVSLLTATAGFLAFWLAPGGTASGSVMALGGLLLAGLGVAGLFPIVNSLALASSGGRMVEASARLSLAIGTSILLLPLFLARLADGFGIRAAYGLELALLLGAIGVAAFAGRKK